MWKKLKFIQPLIFTDCVCVYLQVDRERALHGVGMHVAKTTDSEVAHSDARESVVRGVVPITFHLTLSHPRNNLATTHVRR